MNHNEIEPDAKRHKSNYHDLVKRLKKCNATQEYIDNCLRGRYEHFEIIDSIHKLLHRSNMILTNMDE